MQNVNGILYLFFRGIFPIYTFNLCGNKSGVLVQVCSRFGNTLFYFRRKILRNKIVTALLERILELTGENALTLKQSVDEDGNVTVTITVAIKED